MRMLCYEIAKTGVPLTGGNIKIVWAIRFGVDDERERFLYRGFKLKHAEEMAPMLDGSGSTRR
jgi:hypothetical protein